MESKRDHILDLNSVTSIITLNVSGGGSGLVTKSCMILATPWTVACQAPLSMGFPRQEYWSGLTFPPPGKYK